jgi:aminoglycoside phosphotransferase (APT) family kinase protein
VPTWAPEVVVEPELAAELIGEQFPALRGRTPLLLGAGWDVTAYLLDDAWVFRFPRRQIAVPGVEREIAVLPRLAPFVPVPIPVPALVGAPSERFRWPFFGARFIAGVEATGTEEQREPLARALGEALSALHSADVFEALGASLPDNPTQRVEMRAAVPRARERLAEISDAWTPPALVADVLERALALPAPRLGAVCHGDLHFRHLLVRDGDLSGIIDWVDVCRGDPALDLQLYWSFFEPPEREVFAMAYGPIDEEQLLRARVIALLLNGALAAYGRHEGLRSIEREALASLTRAVSP